MHTEAYDGFARMREMSGIDPNLMWFGLDVGGADVNGSVRAQFPLTAWTGLDIAPAPGVDIVGNAATLPAFPRFDLVIATELFEHTAEWPQIIQQMSRWLQPGGPELFIATCASTGRPPHGARGEWGVPEGQYYGNVTPEALAEELKKYFIKYHVEYNLIPGDAYMWAQGVR